MTYHERWGWTRTHKAPQGGRTYAVVTKKLNVGWRWWANLCSRRLRRLPRAPTMGKSSRIALRLDDDKASLNGQCHYTVSHTNTSSRLKWNHLWNNPSNGAFHFVVSKAKQKHLIAAKWLDHMQDGETIWPSVEISFRFTAWETTPVEFHHGETTSFSLLFVSYKKVQFCWHDALINVHDILVKPQWAWPNGSWNTLWDRVAMVASSVTIADRGVLVDGCHLLSTTNLLVCFSVGRGRQTWRSESITAARHCWGMAAPFPSVASKDALQAKEPPTSEVSEDILHPENLRAVACGGPWKKTNINDSSCRAKCVQGLH